MPLLRLLPMSYDPEYVDDDIMGRYEDVVAYPDWYDLWRDVDFTALE